MKTHEKEFVKKRVLEKQEYVFDNEFTVEEKLKQLGEELGGVSIKVADYVMIACN